MASFFQMRPCAERHPRLTPPPSVSLAGVPPMVVGINNAGGHVYILTKEEAGRRILTDCAGMLSTGAGEGFIARASNRGDFGEGRFAPCNGTCRKTEKMKL